MFRWYYKNTLIPLCIEVVRQRDLYFHLDTGLFLDYNCKICEQKTKGRICCSILSPDSPELLETWISSFKYLLNKSLPFSCKTQQQGWNIRIYPNYNSRFPLDTLFPYKGGLILEGSFNWSHKDEWNYCLSRGSPP